MLLKLARQSLWNRRSTALLTVISLTISIALLLGIDHLRREAKQSFTSTLSGTDLIIGARSGSTNLLLYSVFRIGNATNNISWDSYQAIDTHSLVEWTIPLSLGDSHRGFRVLGTNDSYFEHYRYGKKQTLEFLQGKPFNGVYEAVIGSQVARKLGYQVGEEIIVSHGIGETDFAKHDDKPFTIVGILRPTGTPVDQTVHVSLAGIEAIHVDWQTGTRIPGQEISAEEALEHDLQPKNITACLVGLNSKMATFNMQRKINTYGGEALMAILPGVALSELWQMLGMVENTLLVISFLVLLATLVGMMTTLLASMKERQREMAILRAMGAHASYLFILVEMEIILLAALGVAGGFGLLSSALAISQPWLASEFGLFLSINPIGKDTLSIAGGIIGLAAVLGVIPALAAYRKALSEGLVAKT
ncbi:ABC transporter permease [Porticoccaceae bacterium LTM1]|nr:ABC transporter permease [Porticoccaceae bacterium LTM1]